MMDTPPLPVLNALVREGLATCGTSFHALSGGRTNRLWRFEHEGRNLVAKLFRGDGTPLFPNDPCAEAQALRHLAGTGLAPDFVALLDSPEGSLLVYRHVDGPVWQNDFGSAGETMARLHATPPPPELRKLTSENSPVAQGEALLSACGTKARRRLAPLRPEINEMKPAQPVFLHGDIVPDNIVAAKSGNCLIDWQCPAIGDPVEDIAIFLSPAMHRLYGGHALQETDAEQFFAGYGDMLAEERYRIHLPAYCWRMAAYCLWKAEHGDADYEAAAQLEINALTRRRP